MRNTRFALSVALAAFAVVLISCKEDTTGPGATKLRPISNLAAYSKSDTEVGLTWSASPDAANADEHHITVKLGPDTVATVAVPITLTNRVIGGLIEGRIYTFSVIVEAHGGTYAPSDPVTIQWSPARRITTDFPLPEIKVYETSSAAFPSGLIFYNAPTNSSKTVSIANPGADSLRIDVYVRTESNNAVSLRSAHLFRSTWRITRFSSVHRDADSLDDPRPQPPDTTTYASTNFSVTIDSVAVTSSRIYYFKGADGNYGRILIKRNPSNNTLIWGTSPDQYLNVQISYQTVPYNPFAKP